MRDFVLLATHLLVTLAKFLRPGGVRAVAAESLALKHQLLICSRSRQRAPNLTTLDRLVLGLTTMFMRPRRIPKLSVIIKPAALLRFHKALVDGKYRRLFSSSGCPRKPGPKGPSAELIAAIVEMKRRNPKFGYVRIAEQIAHGFGVERADIDGVAVCRMFNRARSGQPLPKHISTDHDPLFRFHRWLANLRILEIDEIKTVPRVPVSHPFVERLIGTIRRELLDRTRFWNALDLERKLQEFRNYYNGSRVHQSLSGNTPEEQAGKPRQTCAALDSFGWREHCRGPFQTPIAA